MLGELIDEMGTHSAHVGGGRRSEPAHALLGEHGVRAAPVGGALAPLHQARALQAVDPAGDPARREVQPAREIGHAQRVLRLLGEMHEHLVLPE